LSDAAVGPASQPRVLQSGGRESRGGGNQLLLYDAPTGAVLLKVYRRRGARWREIAKRLSYRLFEDKRGVTAEERCELERRNLGLWREHGFDVPKLIDRPLPGDYRAETALWLEYCPGRLLRDYVHDAQVPIAERRREVERFASGLAERQRRALEQDERGLVMKHASLTHVLMHDGRQVSFDLETVHSRSAPMLDALASELGGYVRSLLRTRATERDLLGEAFLQGYADAALLRQIVDRGLSIGGVVRAIRRAHDRRRAFSQRDALHWLRDHTADRRS